MGIVGSKRCANYVIFVFRAFHLEENLAVLYVDEADSIVVGGDHHAVRHRLAHELYASHFLAFRELACAVSTLDFC